VSATTLIAQSDLISGIRSLLERVIERPWVAMLELLLIGAVVYTVLRFLQGTRGARLLRAVIIILIVSFVAVWIIADKLQSERIKVLYPYFVLGVFLVSLVAFQAELRRFLLRIGEGYWLQRWVKDSAHLVDPIVTAVEHLSKRKTGALIAIERTGEVGALTEAGVRLDATVTSELLETIFWPGTPLHDLGVIVHSGRLIAAGCQFPLAESGEVDRSLGSRHRAAIGLSQEIDALVIVVSEETGLISVASHGALTRGLEPAALRGLLINELSGGSPRKRNRRGASPEAASDVEKVELDGSSQAA
jgi:diadenylate cyclase